MQSFSYYFVLADCFYKQNSYPDTYHGCFEAIFFQIVSVITKCTDLKISSLFKLNNIMAILFGLYYKLLYICTIFNLYTSNMILNLNK